MTLSFGPFRISQRTPAAKGPLALSCADVSVIVPVRDNDRGISRLVSAFAQHLQGADELRELVIVDDGSRTPLDVPS